MVVSLIITPASTYCKLKLGTNGCQVLSLYQPIISSNSDPLGGKHNCFHLTAEETNHSASPRLGHKQAWHADLRNCRAPVFCKPLWRRKSPRQQIFIECLLYAR